MSALVQPMASASRAAAARTSASCSLVSAGDGASSTQLLVPPLHRAVPDPHGPDGAVGVRNDLDLDVAGPGHQPLEEHGVIAEGLPGLGLGRTSAASRSSALSTRRMPRPPPPADALIITG